MVPGSPAESSPPRGSAGTPQVRRVLARRTPHGKGQRRAASTGMVHRHNHRIEQHTKPGSSDRASRARLSDQSASRLRRPVGTFFKLQFVGNHFGWNDARSDSATGVIGRMGDVTRTPPRFFAAYLISAPESRSMVARSVQPRREAADRSPWIGERGRSS
jgi:hypothetical protein